MKIKYQKEGSQCICLSVILIDLVSKIDKKHYTEVFSQGCGYIIKE